MMRKSLLSLLLVLAIPLNSFALGGVSSNTQSKFNQNQLHLKEVKERNLDLRKIAKEASLELKEEETHILGDLRILWQYAVEKSETIKFAIYKLSDPKGEGNIKDESKLKKLLKPIASIAPFAAATAGNAVASGSTMLGESILGGILSEEAYNKRLEKVTDADLVILAKAIEDLQNELVIIYYEYVSAKKVLSLADRNLKNREQLREQSQYSSDKSTVIADTFYRVALDKQRKAQQSLLLKRSALEQLVGNEAILKIEAPPCSSKLKEDK